MGHSASLATSRVGQHRIILRSMWSPWVDSLSERPCCDGGLTSSAPIRLSWLLGHVAPGKGNKANNTQLDSWPSALRSRLPFFLVACIATLAVSWRCVRAASIVVMCNDEEQWNTRPAVSAVNRQAELSSSLTKTLYVCDKLHRKTRRFLGAASRIAGITSGTMVLSTPR